MLSKLLFADTTLDGAITKAAVDITGKCDEKSILVIDDFESPSQAMTLYIREQLADSIFAEEELVQIVTRENMDKVEKEFEFQNSGVASEKTILSVAERLGARFIIFLINIVTGRSICTYRYFSPWTVIKGKSCGRCYKIK